MKNILVVDDSRTVRDVLTSTLSEAGYLITEANDGASALEKIKSTLFDAFITDLNMPNMSGVDLIKVIRTEAGYRFTPIIMLTSESQPEQIKVGKAAGASAWLTKPFKTEQLLAVMKMVCPI